MIEQWKPIPGYEGTYEVSNVGNVRRLAGSDRCFVTRQRKLVLRNGYYQLILSRDNKVELHWVHRLVARTFIGEPPRDLPHVNHKNGIKTDNRVDNLEWVNHSENIAHAYRIGLKKAAPNPGEKNGNASLRDADIPEIRSRATNGERLASIGKRYGVSKHVIWGIVHRRSWRHIP